MLPFLFALTLLVAMSFSEPLQAPAGQTVDSTTLVPDTVFTSGIEGPAVGRDGRVFIVNYEKEGTIGVVEPDGKASLFVTLPGDRSPTASASDHRHPRPGAPMRRRGQGRS